MKPQVSAGWVFLLIISILTLASGCLEGEPGATGETSPEPTPQVDQPTPIPPSAPVDTPTVTPIPPSPTPTPTHGELTIAQLAWYEVDEVFPGTKSHLTLLLLEVSEKYPLLFDALVQKAWVTSVEAPRRIVEIEAALDLLRFIASTESGEMAAVHVLNMPFLDDFRGGHSFAYHALRTFMEAGPGPFQAFLDHAIANNSIADSDTGIEIWFMYLEAQDPEGMQLIFKGEPPASRDIYLLEDLVELHTQYPTAYLAVSEHVGTNYLHAMLMSNVSSLAAVDEQLAQRLAQMPFNGIPGGLDQAAWAFTTRAAQEDPEATSTILESYEMRGGIDHTELADYMIDVASVFAPVIVERIRGFFWVQDGLGGPEFREDERGVRAKESDNEDSVADLLWGAYHNEAWVEEVTTKDWIKNSLSTDEERVIRRLRGFDAEIAGQLAQMEFLDNVTREDSNLVGNLHYYLSSPQFPGFSLPPVLDDPRINGEITDANRHQVYLVINELLGQ